MWRGGERGGEGGEMMIQPAAEPVPCALFWNIKRGMAANHGAFTTPVWRNVRMLSKSADISSVVSGAVASFFLSSFDWLSLCPPCWNHSFCHSLIPIT